MLLSPRRRAYLALLTITFIWGLNPIISKLSFEFVTPLQLLSYRFILTLPLSLPILCYYFLIKKTHLSITQLFSVIFLEGLVALDLSLFYIGINYSTATEASLIGLVGPIFVTLGGIVFLHEQEENHEWIGLILAFIGSLIIVLDPLITGYEHLFSLSLFGNLLILIKVLLGSARALAAKKLYTTIPKPLAANLGFWVTGAIIILVTYLFNQPLSVSHLQIPIVLGTSLYMALFASVIAFSLYLYAFSLIEASEATLFGYLAPLVTIPLALVILHESLNWPVLLGLPFILIGIIFAESRRPLSLHTWFKRRLPHSHHLPHHRT